MTDQYTLKKETANSYRILNTKTNKLLKPIYKSRETALRNLEKKNCKQTCNEKANKKYPTEKKPTEKKPTEKKPTEKKVTMKATEKKVTMKAIKSKVKKDEVKQKKEAKRIPKLPKVLTKMVREYEAPSSTNKKLWNGLKDELIKIYETYDYAYKMHSAVELVATENKNKVPKIVQQVIDASNPRLIREFSDYKSPPKEVIDKISKIILRNNTDTKKIVDDVIDKLYDSEKYYAKMENNEIGFSGGFDGIYEVDFEESGDYSFYVFKNRSKELKELKDRTEKDRNKFYDNLIKYFQAKAQKIKRDVTIDNI